MDEFFELEKIATQYALKLASAPEDKKMGIASEMMSAMQEKMQHICKKQD